MTHLDRIALGTTALDKDRLVLELGGGYTLSHLVDCCHRLPPRDQLVLRQMVANFAPWLRSRGLVTVDEFLGLWEFATCNTVAPQVSPVSRARLEHALSHLNRTNHYHAVRSNALFMLALGLGIHPRHAYALKVMDVNRIRKLFKRHNCYTQWAWSYIDKQIANRRIQIKPHTYNGYLFYNLDGTPMDIDMAREFANLWPRYYGLDVKSTLLAHRTMAVELAGIRHHIDTLYERIFDLNGTTTIKEHRNRRPPTPPADAITPVDNDFISYWQGTPRVAPSFLTPSTVISPPVLDSYRAFISRHYLDARRNQTVRQRVSRYRPAPVDKETGG